MRQLLSAACLSSLFAVGLVLGGCGPDGPTKADTGLAVGAIAGGILGNQVGRGGGRVAATAIGAVVGGIVGNEIGRSLDRQDRLLAQQAEYAALERGRSGERIPWRNPDNGRYGEVVPGSPFERGRTELPRIYAPCFHRRPAPGHARDSLPQSRRDLGKRQLSPTLTWPMTGKRGASARVGAW